VSDPTATCIHRVRLANGAPILVERTWIPHYLCPALLEHDFETTSLYEVLTGKLRLDLYRADETFEVSSLSAEDARNLECERGQPAFSIQRITYRQDDTPVEFTQSVGRGDRLRFTVQLVAQERMICRDVVNIEER